MLKLLQLLLLGTWGPSSSVRALNKRVRDLEERADYVEKAVRRLRGHLTGGLRNDEEDESSFPEGEFERLLAARRAQGGSP